MDRKQILEQYTISKNKQSDIGYHLPKLLEYAYKCRHITEMGVRYVESTWAFLLASIDTGSIVVSYDIVTSEQVKELKAAHPSWKFIEGDTGKVTISTTDFLFIDTLHTYDHLKKELELHADKVVKYIGFHDIDSFGFHSENGDTKGLLKAIHEFLIAHQEWEVIYYTPVCNGLMILGRV